MNADEIQVERTPQGSTIRLPYRELQQARKLGWIAVGVGTLLLIFMLSWMSGSIFPGLNMVRNGQWFGIVLILFGMAGLPGVFFALLALTVGQSILKGRTRGEIVINDRQLVYREVFGWFSKRFKQVQLENLERLEIVKIENLFSVESSSNQLKLDSWLPADSSCIRVYENVNSISDNKLKPYIAIAYPSEQLLALAPILNDEITHAAQRFGISLPNPERLQASLALADSSAGLSLAGAYAINTELPPPNQPADSKIEIIRSPGQPTVFRLPATGLTGHARSLFVFSCFWNGMVLFMIGVFVVSFLSKPAQWLEMLIFPLFLTPFLAIGIGLLVYTLSLAKRTSMIGIDERQLFCETKGLRKTKWIEVDRQDIESIQLEASGTSVNNQPLRQIRINRHDKSQKPAIMFTGLPDNELEWICYQLKTELGLIEPAGET